MKTNQQVQELISNWKQDPTSWILENTPGFEDHREYLKSVSDNFFKELKSGEIYNKKTREDLEILIRDWKEDPCYDLEDVEGFEEYREELLQVSIEHQEKLAKEKKEKEFEIALETNIPMEIVQNYINYIESADKDKLKAQELLFSYFENLSPNFNFDNQVEINYIVTCIINSAINYVQAEIYKANNQSKDKQSKDEKLASPMTLLQFREEVSSVINVEEFEKITNLLTGYILKNRISNLGRLSQEQLGEKVTEILNDQILNKSASQIAEFIDVEESCIERYLKGMSVFKECGSKEKESK